MSGIRSANLAVQTLSFEAFLSSQQGSYNHRHKALKYRIQQAEKQGAVIPPKRHTKENISFDFKWVQLQRSVVRKNSLLFWSNTHDVVIFEEKMRKSLGLLDNLTVLYHYKRAFIYKIRLR
jgi:hypothetical protein